jgi:nicotinamidase-related amidase
VHTDIQEIGDKIVYNTIEEILDPSHIALVLWDVVYAFTNMIYNKEEFSRNLNSVVELARKSNIPISVTSHQMLSKRFEYSNIYTASKLGLDRLFE